MVRENKIIWYNRSCFYTRCQGDNTLPNIRPINKIEICAFIKKKKLILYWNWKHLYTCTCTVCTVCNLNCEVSYFWIIYWYWIVSVKVTICNLLRPYIWQQGIQDSNCAPCGWWSNSGWWCSRNGTTSKAETSVVYLYLLCPNTTRIRSIRDAGNTVYSVIFALCFFFYPLYLQTVLPSLEFTQIQL